MKGSDEDRVYDDTIKENRLCRLSFDKISNPFLLEATIESHLETYENELANSRLKVTVVGLMVLLIVFIFLNFLY